MWMVPFKSNDIAICVTGCTKYAQYVNRLNGSNPWNDSSLSIGLANPHLHDNTIHTRASPHAVKSMPQQFWWYYLAIVVSFIFFR